MTVNLKNVCIKWGGVFFLFTAISINDHTALAQFCKDEKIEFVVVGPEAPLAAGKVHFYLLLQYMHCQQELRDHLSQFILQMRVSTIIPHWKKSFHLKIYGFYIFFPDASLMWWMKEQICNCGKSFKCLYSALFWCPFNNHMFDANKYNFCWIWSCY